MEFVKLQKFGFIGLGNVGGKLAGSLIRDLDCKTLLAHCAVKIPPILMGKLGSAPESDRQILLSG